MLHNTEYCIIKINKNKNQRTGWFVMVQQELANLAEMVWTLLHSAQHDGQCFYPPQRMGDYTGAFSFCGLTALLSKNGDVRLRAHDLDVVLAQSWNNTNDNNEDEPDSYILDVAGASYNLAFYKGNAAFLKNWYTHIIGLQVCFHVNQDTTQVAL